MTNAPDAEALVPLETYVHPWGKVAAIRWDGRERYYMLVDHDECVSLMPADVVEQAHAAALGAARGRGHGEA